MVENDDSEVAVVPLTMTEVAETQSDRRWVYVALCLSMVTAMAAISTMFVLVLLRDSEADRVATDAERARTAASTQINGLSIRLADAESALECRAELAAQTAAASGVADAAAAEVLIETAEQFHLALTDQPVSPAELRERIDEARAALDFATEINAVYVASIGECSAD